MDGGIIDRRGENYSGIDNYYKMEFEQECQFILFNLYPWLQTLHYTTVYNQFKISLYRLQYLHLLTKKTFHRLEPKYYCQFVVGYSQSFVLLRAILMIV